VQEKADSAGAVAVWGDHRAQEEGHAHPREPQAAGGGLDGGHEDGGERAPEEDVAEVHAFLPAACWGGGPGRSGRVAPSVWAALMRPTWVKACGKLPRASPVAGSN